MRGAHGAGRARRQSVGLKALRVVEGGGGQRRLLVALLRRDGARDVQVRVVGDIARVVQGVDPLDVSANKRIGMQIDTVGKSGG